MRMKGRKVYSNFLLATCYLGDMGYELMQPLDKKSLFYDFLQKYGENLHHIGYETDKYEKGLEIVKNKGLKILMSGNFYGNDIFSYIDGAQELKHIFEFFK